MFQTIFITFTSVWLMIISFFGFQSKSTSAPITPTPIQTITPKTYILTLTLTPTPTSVQIVKPTHIPTRAPTLTPTRIPTPSIPWGTTEKIGDHTYRTYIGQDTVMSTEDEFVTALNVYRRLHGVGELFVSDTLCKLADYRINQLVALGGLDAHAGFKEYLAKSDGWSSLPRFTSVGENNSYGYVQSGTRLVEWVFDADEEHRSNQLSAKWNRLCVRIRNTIVEVVFGQEQ